MFVERAETKGWIVEKQVCIKSCSLYAEAFEDVQLGSQLDIREQTI